MLNIFRNVFLVLSLLFSLSLTAAETEAKIINAYFASDAVEVDGWLQPERIIKEVKGNHPATAAVFVLNILLPKGTHKIEAPVYGPDGKQFTVMKFATEKVENTPEVKAIWGILKGRLPTGGITVEVKHIKDSNKTRKLGRFYLPTI